MTLVVMKKENSMRVAIYVRVSTHQQTTQNQLN
jgi:predicted site-specific integrase-resolvase